MDYEHRAASLRSVPIAVVATAAGTPRRRVAAIAVLLFLATVIGAGSSEARTPRDWAIWATFILVFAGTAYGFYLIATGLDAHGVVRTAIPAWRRCRLRGAHGDSGYSPLGTY